MSTTATRRRRTRSTFKKSAGTELHLQEKVFALKDNKFETRHRQGGGLGFLNNNCRCKSCKDSRFAF